MLHTALFEIIEMHLPERNLAWLFATLSRRNLFLKWPEWTSWFIYYIRLVRYILKSFPSYLLTLCVRENTFLLY